MTVNALQPGKVAEMVGQGAMGAFNDGKKWHSSSVRLLFSTSPQWLNDVTRVVSRVELVVPSASTSINAALYFAYMCSTYFAADRSFRTYIQASMAINCVFLAQQQAKNMLLFQAVTNCNKKLNSLFVIINKVQ